MTITHLTKHLNFPPDAFPPPLPASSSLPAHCPQSWGSVRGAFLFLPLFVSCSFFPTAPAWGPPQAAILSNPSQRHSSS